MEIIDAQARQDALDPERSFIVQAPAGSGKTGLLIQRYLSLLSRVKSPEEIIAITFTRKAAAEMKERVISALAGAGSGGSSGSSHEQETWALACKAQKEDNRHGWNIRQNPARLRICTIDSLCVALTRQLPILSGFGMQPRIADDASHLYREAAANTVMELESAASWSDSLEALILHLDNNISKVEELIAQMLSRRDQWLRHVIDSSDIRIQRQSLESALSNVIETALRKTRSHMPESVLRMLPDLAMFAAKNLFTSSPASAICACLEMKEIPQCTPYELETWKGIANLLLTGNGEFRKGIDKRVGFPPGPHGSKAKSSFKTLLAELEGRDDFAASLHAVRHLPAPYYTDDQWHLTEALFEILKLSVAHLQLIFEKSGLVDFTEMSLRAQAALGGADDPTDLALLLDYGIQHILVDEFQDTSISQFELISRLTAGWYPGDAKTFFAVGDPMQSIYSFREAEVGLFLKAWESGLGPHMPLKRLRLASNFRSDRGIVDWVNATFAGVFPEKNEPGTGAVAYAPSQAVHPMGDSPAVGIHPVVDGDDETAARKVVACILAAQSNDPGKSIAVLVRSRSHLRKIIPAMREAGIRYAAVEIEALGQRPVISDLTAITRALSHPADRIAWLALLRGPWCALSLKDLFVIAGNDHDTAIYDLLCDADRIARLSADGRIRLGRVMPVISAAMKWRGRRSLRQMVETTWTALGGPACVKEADLHDASVYFDFLEKKIGYGAMNNYETFETEVMGLFSSPPAEVTDLVNVMTIHKAKGLEFDTVILPVLEKSPRSDTEKLLLWQETPDTVYSGGLLLAPISETGSGDDPTYQYIKKLHGEKISHEVKRLLYVAATRARKRLDLVASVKRNGAGDISTPDQRSLLGCLWPVVAAFFAPQQDDVQLLTVKKAAGSVELPCVRRLSANWQAPALPGDAEGQNLGEPAFHNPSKADGVRFDWAGMTARITGTIIHKWLRTICEAGLENWDNKRIGAASDNIRWDLARAGMERGAINDAAGMVASALADTLEDDTGRWLLSSHQEGKCEYSLAGVFDNRIISVVIDRTFIDEKGVRWIVDYKSGTHRGGGLNEFMQQEQLRYENQMALYAALMTRRDPGRQIRRALYFPMFSGWSPWPL